VKALITGIGGFCGWHLVRRLRLEQGVEIAGLDTKKGRPSAHSDIDRFFQADVRDAEAIASAVRTIQPDWLFHLAGVSGSGVPEALIYEVNVFGTLNVIEAVRGHAPECSVLVVGSSAEYGPVEPSMLPIRENEACHPFGPYGISKYAASLMALDYADRHDLNVVVARPFNIVGAGVPASLVVGALIQRAKHALAASDPVIKVGDLEAERDFVAAYDAVDAYVRLVQGRFSREIFNICSGRAYSIRHVAGILLANATRPITLEFDPGLVPRSPVRRIYGSYEKAEKAIGFRPSVSLEEALKDAWCGEIGTGTVCESRS